jgi:hypothetical protein
MFAYEENEISIRLDIASNDWIRFKRHENGNYFVMKALCYDCAWLSLTALSTVTRNLWL